MPFTEVHLRGVRGDVADRERSLVIVPQIGDDVPHLRLRVAVQ